MFVCLHHTMSGDWFRLVAFIATLFNSRVLLTVIQSVRLPSAGKQIWTKRKKNSVSTSGSHVLLVYLINTKSIRFVFDIVWVYDCVRACMWLSTWKHLPNCRGENAYKAISHARQFAINGAKLKAFHFHTRFQRSQFSSVKWQRESYSFDSSGRMQNELCYITFIEAEKTLTWKKKYKT